MLLPSFFAQKRLIPRRAPLQLNREHSANIETCPQVPGAALPPPLAVEPSIHDSSGTGNPTPLHLNRDRPPKLDCQYTVHPELFNPSTPYPSPLQLNKELDSVVTKLDAVKHEEQTLLKASLHHIQNRYQTPILQTLLLPNPNPAPNPQPQFCVAPRSRVNSSESSRAPSTTSRTGPHSAPTLPYPTLPYPTLPYPTLPCPTLPYLALPYPTLPYFTLPCRALPYPALPDPPYTLPTPEALP